MSLKVPPEIRESLRLEKTLKIKSSCEATPNLCLQAPDLRGFWMPPRMVILEAAYPGAHGVQCYRQLPCTKTRSICRCLSLGMCRFSFQPGLECVDLTLSVLHCCDLGGQSVTHFQWRTWQWEHQPGLNWAEPCVSSCGSGGVEQLQCSLKKASGNGKGGGTAFNSKA